MRTVLRVSWGDTLAAGRERLSHEHGLYVLLYIRKLVA